MTEADFIRQFEDASLEDFHHRDHVRMGWCYLRESPVLVALERFTSALKRFATAKGSPQLYHETITWAYLFLIHERMNGESSWEEFADRNPDLLTWKPSILDRYYRAETLASDRARAHFLLPDAIPEFRSRTLPR